MNSRRASTARCDHGFLLTQAHRICYECRSVFEAARKLPITLPVDITGLEIGKVKVMHKGKGDGWFCKCKCGNFVTINRVSLLRSLQKGYVSACPDCRDFRPHPKEELRETS